VAKCSYQLCVYLPHIYSTFCLTVRHTTDGATTHSWRLTTCENVLVMCTLHVTITDSMLWVCGQVFIPTLCVLAPHLLHTQGTFCMTVRHTTDGATTHCWRLTTCENVLVMCTLHVTITDSMLALWVCGQVFIPTLCVLAPHLLHTQGTFCLTVRHTTDGATSHIWRLTTCGNVLVISTLHVTITDPMLWVCGQVFIPTLCVLAPHILHTQGTFCLTVRHTTDGATTHCWRLTTCENVLVMCTLHVTITDSMLWVCGQVFIPTLCVLAPHLLHTQGTFCLTVRHTTDGATTHSWGLTTCENVLVMCDHH
jgi:hypothetical protein